MKYRRGCCLLLFIVIFLSANVYTESFNGVFSVVVLNPIPIINLNYPLDSFRTNNNSVLFNCSANDDFMLSNLTLYVWDSYGNVVVNSTENFTGTYNESSSIQVLSDGNYEWNCFAWDNESHSSFGGMNNTFSVDGSAPNVTLIAPVDLMSTTSSVITFDYSVSDFDSILNCSLIMNDILIDSEFGVERNVRKTFISSRNVGIHLWRVQCLDSYGNLGVSSTREFNIFSITPPETISGGSGGSGDSGDSGDSTPVVSLKNDSVGYYVDREFVEVDLVIGTEIEEIVNMINYGEEDMTFNFRIEGLDGFVVLTDDSFILPSGEVKRLRLFFNSSDDSRAGVYYGKLIIYNEDYDVSLNISIVLEVRADNPLFDLKVDVPEENVASRKMKIAFDIISLNDVEEQTIFLFYSINDLEGNVLSSWSEDVLVDGSLSFERSIDVTNLDLGRYVVYSNISYEGGYDTGYDSFLIVGESSGFEWPSVLKEDELNYFIFIVSGVVFVIIIYFILRNFVFRFFLRKRKEKKVNRKDKKTFMSKDLKNMVR